MRFQTLAVKMVSLTRFLLLVFSTCSAVSGRVDKVWTRTKHTLSEFEVGGVNVAVYGMPEQEGATHNNASTSAPPFELFEEFNCLRLRSLNGDEDWRQIQDWFKHKAEGKSLSFYNDKVSLKRWLPTVGYDIPKPFALRFASELTSTGNVEDETNAILKLLPKNTDYVAKPSHQFGSRGVWVVSHDDESGTTRVSRNASETLHVIDDFDPKGIAQDLAHHLHGYGEALKRAAVSTQAIEPGIVIEERFTTFNIDDQPALEFKVLCLWGRVHVAQWRRGGYVGEWFPGVVDREGNMIEGSKIEFLPDWVDWSRVVDIAERLGAHKDMFRTDILVGVGAGSPALREGASDTEQRDAARYVVSEISHISSEPFPREIMEESLRLWIAGYKIGNYRLVPNTEVPLEFRDHPEHHEEQ